MLRYPLVLIALVGCSKPDASGNIDPELAAQLAATDGTVDVIVVSTGARDVAASVDDVGGEFVGACDHLPLAMVRLDADQAAALAAAGQVWLAPDRPILGAGASSHGDSDDDHGHGDLVRRTIGADLVQSGRNGVRATGDGVTIALVDSGVDASYRDFPSHLLVDYADFTGGKDSDARKDPYGHGTMVASVLVDGRSGFTGVAPDVQLISARVLDDTGAGTTSAAIRALDWIIDQGDADVINISIGAAPSSSFTRDPLDIAVEAAVRDGMIVVAAAGNYGTSDGTIVYGGVVSPANDPLVITVGAADGNGTARRTDDTVASFSSRGPTLWDGLGKPDLVAPARNLALPAGTSSTLYKDHRDARVTSWAGASTGGSSYLVTSGTSFSAPMVAGTIALMLEANPDLSATDAKAILELTSTDLGDPTLLGQGAGELNAIGAVRLAAYWGAVDGHHHPAQPVPSDTIEGATATWSTRILWDGYAAASVDLSALDANGVKAVGDISGSGILWDGGPIQYIGVTVTGIKLLNPATTAWSLDATWGSGILWDGGVSLTSGRVWADPTVWSSSLVRPNQLAGAGVASPLFDAPLFTALTTPTPGEADPTPPMPTFY